MRTLSVLVILVLVSGSTAAFAQDSGLMLEQEPRKDFTGFGWTFLLLSVATLAFGVKSKADSDDDLERAEANFAAQIGYPVERQTLRVAITHSQRPGYSDHRIRKLANGHQ